MLIIIEEKYNKCFQPDELMKNSKFKEAKEKIKIKDIFVIVNTNLIEKVEPNLSSLKTLGLN